MAAMLCESSIPLCVWEMRVFVYARFYDCCCDSRWLYGMTPRSTQTQIKYYRCDFRHYTNVYGISRISHTTGNAINREWQWRDDKMRIDANDWWLKCATFRFRSNVRLRNGKLMTNGASPIFAMYSVFNRDDSLASASLRSGDLFSMRWWAVLAGKINDENCHPRNANASDILYRHICDVLIFKSGVQYIRHTVWTCCVRFESVCVFVR